MSRLATILVIASPFLAPPISAQVAVTIRVVDQAGTEIAGSLLSITGAAHLVPTGSSVNLAIGSHDVDVYPGVFGHPHTGFARVVAGVGVTAATQSIDLQWITQDVVVRVKDQHGVELPGSGVRFAYPNFFVPTGSTVTLPITDESVYPTMGGAGVLGYDLDVQPGVFGTLQSNFVYTVLDNEISQTTSILEYEWITQDVVVRVKDQHGVEIPGAGVSFAYPALWVPTGTAITVPITDEGAYPTMAGPGRLGYDLDVFPGIAGSRQYSVARTVLDNEVGMATTALEYEWSLHACPLQVVDAQGVPVPASAILLPWPFGPFQIGDTVSLPVTENAVYPSIVGSWADGIPISVAPGDLYPAVSGTFQFEVLGSGALAPPSFEIGGRTYSLVCMLNRPPDADAGGNLAIQTWQVPATTLAGTGLDPDLDPLTYRWLEGAAVLFGPASVTSGAAPLDLAPLLGLSTGSHQLTLEVSDGMQIGTDTMTLTIGNSAPTAACSGGGTFQAGVDVVVLRATVADFDGDALAYQWRSGSTVHSAGVLQSQAGATPIEVPETVLTTGSSATADLGPGAHVLTLLVDDGHNPAVNCDVAITVIDTQEPRLAPVSSHGILWPPDHRMVDVTIDAHASDASGGPVFLAASVTSTEDPSKNGSGNTMPDVVGPVVDQQTGTIFVQLRAERSGRGGGRTYTVTIAATDVALNQSSTQVMIEAPHDRSAN